MSEVKITPRTYKKPAANIPEIIPETQKSGLRFGIVSPGLVIGGADQWIIDMLNHVDVNWVGVGVLKYQTIHQIQSEQVEKHCDIFEGDEGIKNLINQCDVCFCWGIINSGKYFSGQKCRAILVSHGTAFADYTVRTLKDAHKFDALCAVSDLAKEAYPVSQQERVKVLFLGSDPKRCAQTKSVAAIRQEWGVPEGAKVLGYIGRFDALKHQIAVIEALPYLPREWHAVMVGAVNGANVKRYQDRAVQLGVFDRLRIVDATNEVGNAYAAFDWNVFCSDMESWGLVTVESWLAGTPVIATPTGAALKHPEFVVPAPFQCDGKTLAKIILKNDGKKTTRGKVFLARDYALDNYSMQAFGERWRDIAIQASQIKRVGIVMPCALRGGAERSSLMFARYVTDKNIRYQGAAILRDYDDSMLEEFKQHGKVLLGEAGARELAMECDVLMTWGIPDPKSRFAKELPCKIIQTSRGNDTGFTEMAMRGCENAAAIIACSPSALDGIPEAQRGRGIVIPNTVPLERLQSQLTKRQAQKKLGIPRGKKVLGFVGRLDENKNPYVFIDALKYLPSNYVLLMAGRETNINIQKYARDIADRFYYIGAVDDVADVYKAMDAFICPSRNEGFCNVIAEAWACGVPVISTKVGMTTEQPDLSCLFVPDISPESLANVITGDFDMPAMQDERAEKAFKYVTEELSAESFAQKWREVIMSC